MRGRRSRLVVEMDAATRTLLEGWLRRQKTPVGLAKRARAMLLLTAGQPYTHTAAQVGLAERHVRKWAQRFVAAGPDGLHDRPRPGRQPVFPPGGGRARPVGAYAMFSADARAGRSVTCS